MVRRHVLRHLIWVCSVCLCPTKRTLGLYGLSLERSQVSAYMFAISVMWVLVTCWERAELFALLCVMYSCDFCCSSIQLYVLLRLYLCCFFSFLYLDLYVQGDVTLIS